MISNWAEPRRLRFQSSALSFIFQQTPVALVGSTVNALAYVYLSWTFVHRAYLCLWLTVLFTSLGLRVLLWRSWTREKITPFRMAWMRRWLGLSIAVSALVWGVMGSVFLVTGSTLHFTMTVFLLAGLTAGGVAAYGALRGLAYLYLILTVGPLVIRLILEKGAVNDTLAGLAGAYMTLMAFIVRNLNCHITRTINTGLDNEDLQRCLSAASHEIRTPVATICGFVEVMAESPETSLSNQKCLAVIQRNCSYLRGLLEQMLLMGRAQAGAAVEKPELVELRAQIAAAYDTVERAVKAKGLYYQVELARDVPESVVIQPLKVQQILVNLLTNAAKFTTSGGISVIVELASADQLAIRVADTGIGVAPENHEKLFEYFWRERRLNGGGEGAGVGLAVSRGLARCMGGDLRLVSSMPGQGSTFELLIPFSRNLGASENR